MMKPKNSPSTIQNALRIYILLRDEPGRHTKRSLAERFGIHIDSVSYLFDQMRAAGIEILSDGEPGFTWSIGKATCAVCGKEKTRGHFAYNAEICSQCLLEKFGGQVRVAQKVVKLGTKHRKNRWTFWTFEDARAWMRANAPEVNSSKKWAAYKKGAYPHLPEKPPQIRADLTMYPEFEGYDRFFGRVSPKDYMPYQEAKEYAILTGIKNLQAFIKYVRQNDIPFPTHPEQFYPEWPGWKKFINKPGPVKRKKRRAKK